MTTEQFFCVNCSFIGSLDSNLHCSSCGSDSVVSTLAIRATADKLTPKKSEATVLHSTTSITTEFHPLHTHGYLIQYQSFESFVSWREAGSVESAIEFATHNSAHPWYGIQGSSAPISGVEGKPLTHNDYCDWLRRGLEVVR